MKVFKLHETVELPAYATEGSAAFDLRAHLVDNPRVRAYNPMNREIEIPVKVVAGKLGIQIHPQYRVLVPTGLIFDIPKNNVLKIYARSGTALKQGLTLANAVGVVDSDYVEETFVMLLNVSEQLVVVNHGDRIAQAVVESVKQLSLTETKERPGQKTSRNGGLGSTGKE